MGRRDPAAALLARDLALKIDDGVLDQMGQGQASVIGLTGAGARCTEGGLRTRVASQEYMKKVRLRRIGPLTTAPN